MRFAIKFADKIVGLFVLIAIIGLLGVVIVLGANQRWFAKNYYFHTFFQSGSGISRGMSITFKGFEIGKVSDIGMNQDNEVVVHFYIYDTYYSKVKINSVIQLSSSPLGSSLLFYPGKSQSAPLDEFSEIPSLNSEEGKSIVAFHLAEIPAQADDSISAILKNVDEITFQLNTFLKNNADELDGIVTSLASTTGALAGAMEGNASGPVGEIFTRLVSTVKNIENLTADIDGLIPRLLDPTGGQQVFPAIMTILQNIESTTADLKKFAEFIIGTEPQIAGILEQGRQTLNVGKDVLEGISNNPLIRGGITEEREQPSTLRSFRDEAFYSMKRLVAVFILCGTLFSCSTSPTQPEGVVEKKNQAAEYSKYGNDYYNQGLYDRALEFFFLALAYNVSVDNEAGIVSTYSSIGSVYIAKGEYDDAMKIFSDAYTKAKKLGDPVLLVQVSTKIGEAYLRTGQIEKAYEYLKEALAYEKKGIPEEDQAVLYHNLGSVQKYLKQLTEALASIDKARKINLRLKRYEELATNYYMIASIYSEQSKFDDALANMQSALEYDKKVENTLGIAKDYLALGKIYQKKGANTEAFENFKKTYLMYLAMKQLYPTLAIESDIRAILTHMIQAGTALAYTTELEPYRRELEYIEKRMQQ